MEKGVEAHHFINDILIMQNPMITMIINSVYLKFKKILMKNSERKFKLKKISKVQYLYVLKSSQILNSVILFMLKRIIISRY